MKTMKVRSPTENDEPPPFYRVVELLVTIRLHYGGLYVHEPCATHIGGSVSVIDNVGISYVSLEGIRRLCDVVGLEGVTELYLKGEDGGFVLVSSDRNLKWYFFSTMANPNIREMSIYVDCVGVESCVDGVEPEGEGRSVGLGEYVNESDDGGDDGDLGEGHWGDRSFECEHSSDSKCDVENGMDFGINVIGGDEGLFDVSLEYSVEDLGDDLQNRDGNAAKCGIVIVDDDSNGVGRGEDILSDSGSTDVVDSGEDFVSLKGSDSENEGSSFPVFSSTEVWKPVFQLGMKFSTKKLLREAVISHAIVTMRNIKIKKNDKRRLYAKCEGGNCEWKLHAVKVDGEEDTFLIRHYDYNHSCSTSLNVTNVKSSWLAKKYIDQFKADPNKSVEDFRLDVMRDIGVYVSKHQAYRARMQALKLLYGNSNVAEQNDQLMETQQAEDAFANSQASVYDGSEEVVAAAATTSYTAIGKEHPTSSQPTTATTYNRAKGKENLTVPFKPRSRDQIMRSVATPASCPVSTFIPGPSMLTQLQQCQRESRKSKIIDISSSTFGCVSSQVPKQKKSKK